jgi:hypothetical protein
MPSAPISPRLIWPRSEGARTTETIPVQRHNDGCSRPSRGDRLRATAWVVGLALAVLLLDLGPVGSGFPSLTGYQDNASFNYPLRLEAARQWTAGRVPLWNPYSLAGTPLLGDITSAVLYPGNLPFLLDVDGPRYRALDRVALLHFVLAALFMYGFARALSLGHAAAAVSGLVYAGNGTLLYFTSEWIQLQNSAVWLPLILTAVHRGADRRRVWLWIAVGSVAIAMQVLSGYPQYVFYTGLLAGAYALTLSLGRAGKGWCPLLALTSMYVLGAALAAVQLAPALEVVAMSPRASPVSLEEFLAAAVSPGMVRGLVIPRGLAALEGLYPVAGCAFVGTLAVVLAIEGARSLRRERLFLSITLVVAFLLALGPYTPVGWLSYQIPGLNFFRYPSKHLFEVTFCLAALAGFGAQSVVDRRRGAAACVTIGATVVLWILSSAPLGRWWIGVAMASTAAFAILVLAGQRRLAVMLALASIWLGLASNRAALLDSPASAAQSVREASQSVVDALANRQPTVLGPRYVAAVVPQFFATVPWEPLLALDYPTEARVPAVHGTTPFLWGPLGTALGMGATGVFDPRIFADSSDQALDVLSGQFIGSASAVPTNLVPRAKPSVKVVPRSSSLPPIRFVDYAICKGSARTSLELHRRKYDFASVALIDCGSGGAAPPVEPASTRWSVALLEDAAGLLRMRVRLGGGGPGLMIVSQSDIPGWRGWVDGKPAPIYRAYGLVQGVVVPAGVHDVELEYLPNSVIVGGWISLAALFALLVVGVLALRAWNEANEAPEIASAAAAGVPVSD